MRQKGFTLLELLTTLAVSALMLSMAVPSVQAFSNNSRQTSATNEFVSSMHLARSTAITSNARVTMCASSTGTSCATVPWNEGWIVFNDTDSDQTVDAGERILGASAGNAELDITSGEFADFLTYRPSGRVANAAANSGEITFCDGRGSSHAKVVIVDLSGRPRTSDTKANGTAPSCP